MKYRYKLVLRISQIKRRWIVSDTDLPIKSTFANGFKIKLPGHITDTVMSEISFRGICHLSIFHEEGDFSLFACEPVTRLYDSQVRSFLKLMKTIKSFEGEDVFTEDKINKLIRTSSL